ncbi:MAG TPA: phenylacetate--CoA ligase [Firmicutes bacterium]|jgi:phenylacetate-CoA ligase|nr:phenylacetate--CoA ligase [Bacillota bacterium]
MFWDKTVETMEEGAIKEMQLRFLNETLSKAAGAPFYRNLPVKEVKSLQAFATVPFTKKQDLRDHFPYGFLRTDLSEAVRLHSSSGTTGNPTVVFHTVDDLEKWTDQVARCLYMVGVRKQDVFQNTMGYGLFTGGLGFQYGAEKLGALTIPIGPGNSRRQIWFMQTFGTTVVHILPSYALRLFSVFEEMGLDPKKDTKLRIFLIGSEPHSEELRRQIEELYGVKAYNSYGLSEMCGPGVGFECPYQDGMHIWEDRYFVEVINPETGEAVPDGEEGELVLTTLQKEAMPLLRYRTGDLTSIIPGRCQCGRVHKRIARIKGRADDMLIINGVNLFPIQIEKAIMKIPGVGKNYLIEIKTENFMDKLYVKVEVEREIFEGTLSSLTGLQERITEELKAEILVTPTVQLAEPGSLPVWEGKAKRVFDKREN